MSIQKIRGTTLDVKPDSDLTQTAIPQDVFRKLAQEAARACSTVCRRFILANMRGAGIRSQQGGLTSAIQKSDAYYDSKRGSVRFRIRGKLRRKGDDRNNALYVQAGALDAGRVVSKDLKGGTKDGNYQGRALKAKRKIKQGLAKNATLQERKFKTAGGKQGVRKAIDLGAVKSVPGRKFWEFTGSQQGVIKQHFRRELAKLMSKHGFGPKAKGK